MIKIARHKKWIALQLACGKPWRQKASQFFVTNVEILDQSRVISAVRSV